MIELRNYMPLFTLEHMAAGIQPIRQQVPGEHGALVWRMFHPPILEYRLMERVHIDGKPVLEWGAWRAVGYVREGDDAPAEAQTRPA